MEKKCIIIDDVEVSRYVLSVLMIELGFDVLEADSVESAIAIVQKNKCHVAIIDWHLRHESGLNLIAELRKTSGNEKLPALVCSGVASGDVASQIQQAGAQAFLNKPVSEEQLRNELKKIGLI